MKRAAIGMAALLLATGCDGARVKELEARKAALETRKAEDTQLAQHIDEIRASYENLKAQFETALPQDATKMRAILEKAAPGVTFDVDMNARRITAEGHGGPRGAADALDRIAGAVPGLSFSFVDATPTTWNAKFRVIPVDADFGVPPDGTIAEPIPTPGKFASANEKKLTAECLDLQREVLVLERLVVEAHTFERLEEKTKNALDGLTGTDRIGVVGPKIISLFGAQLLASGRVSITETLVVHGELAKGIGEADLRKSLKDWEVVLVAPPDVDLRAAP